MQRLLIVVAGFLAASCSTSVIKASSGNLQPEQKNLMAKTHELPRGNPEEVGMSTEQLEKIDDVVQDYIDSGRVLGFVVGGGGAAGTVSWAAPLEELTMVYMVRQRSDLHVKIAKVVSDAIVD